VHVPSTVTDPPPHTVVVGGTDAMQALPALTHAPLPGSQHAGARHALADTPDGQHAWPAPPHSWHWAATQASLMPEQAAFAATHSEAPTSQQPLSAHALPAQQGCPTAPHATHVEPLHALLDVAHELPSQQGCPSPPHVTHDAPLHTIPTVEHAAPSPTH
jgi:hypothetical protein